MQMVILSNRVQKLLLVILLIFMMMISLPIALTYNIGDIKQNSRSSTKEGAEEPVLWKITQGIVGSGPTMQPQIYNFTEEGDRHIVVGTDRGIAIIGMDGTIRSSFLTFGPVIGVELIDDISGDSQKDLVVIVLDQAHANVYAVSSADGKELWSYNPIITGFSQTTLLYQNYTTLTWDVTIINDVDDDGIQDVVLSSWYRLFTLSGIDGREIWRNEQVCSDDIWEVEVFEDINGDGYQEILVGSEDGDVIMLDSKTGTTIWTYQLPPFKVVVYSYASPVPLETTFQTSIADLMIISDLIGDGIDDVLVAGDDGKLYHLSGASGELLDTRTIFYVEKPQTPISFDGEIYDYEKRLFSKSGVMIQEIIDMNGDGVREIMTVAYDLELEAYSETDQLEYSILDISAGTLIRLGSFNLTAYPYKVMSYPCVLNISSEIRVYFHNPSIWYGEMESYLPSLGYFNIEGSSLDGPHLVVEEQIYQDIDFYAESRIGTYILNIGDVTGDAVDDLFGFSRSGYYYVVDTQNGQIIWSSYVGSGSGSTELIKIQDLNGDGINDFLFTRKSLFLSEWQSTSDGEDSGTQKTIVREIVALDAQTGSRIWTFNVPGEEYDGVMDLLNMGDITGDNVDDYASWIIPSRIPTAIKSTIHKYGEGKAINANVYRALLMNYTRVIVIDGKTGEIVWNRSLFDYPYKFTRYSGYTGSYTDPYSEWAGTYGEYYNRINGQISDDWGDQWGYYYWDSIWAPINLVHATSVDIQAGQAIDGKLFDLWGVSGEDYEIISSNSTAELRTGEAINSTSIGTIQTDDELYWLINSSVEGSYEKIIAEFSFNQSQTIDRDLTNVTIDYAGLLSRRVTGFDIYAWNWSENNWNRISGKNINSTSFISTYLLLTDLSDYCNTVTNNSVKIRLEAWASQSFQLTVDQLVARYVYTPQNYTFVAGLTGGKYELILDFSFMLNLSSEKALGLLDYHLSQLERISALKIQSQLAVNDSADFRYYNFTYNLYNFTSGEWVECNWTKNTFWDNRFPDLYGSWGQDRISNTQFDFSTTINTDSMYVVTRGTADRNFAVEFDHENETTLSAFVDPVTKRIRVRMNVTNVVHPFNLTLDTFGIVAFYWGLAPSKYDRYYLWDYGSEWEEPRFTSDQLIDLEVQDFEIINGTGDSYLDILAIIGNNEEYSTNLRLFDVNNDQIYTKWSVNYASIPNLEVRALSFDTSTTNGWILSGRFSGETFDFYASKRVSNAYWTNQHSRFENYSDQLMIIDYQWSINSSTPYMSEFIWPGAIQITKDGDVGIIMPDYSSGYEFDSDMIQIVDPANLNVISKIPVMGLYRDYEYDPGYSSSGFDFSTPQMPGGKLMVASDDFNGDGYFDHIGLYGEYGFYELRVYSGNSGDIEQMLISESFSQEGSGPGSFSGIPFASIGDIDNDQAAELVFGLQGAVQDGWITTRGSSITILNVQQGTKEEYVLDEFVASFGYAPEKEFYNLIKNIGDLNSDNFDDILVGRYLYEQNIGANMYSGSAYTVTYVSEIIDLKNQKILLRIEIPVDDIRSFDDLNADGGLEYLIFSGESLFCANSKFQVKFTNLVDGELLLSNDFTINWDTDASYSYFELMIDGNSYGPTVDTSTAVSLGPGTRKIEIFMHDESGVLVAISTVQVTVPPNTSMLILTVGGGVAIIATTIVYRIAKKKKQQITDKILKNQEM